MKYKTPLCKSFSVMPEGIICVSGTGTIDDGTIVPLNSDASGNEFDGVLPGLEDVNLF